MKMFKVITLSAFIAMTVFANSCKVIYPNERKIVGKWNPVKIEKIDPAVTPTTSSSARPGSAAKMDTVAGKKGKNAQGLNPGDSRDNQLTRMATIEERTSLEVYAEKKMVVKQYPKKTFKGTWKLKKKGMQVQVKEIQTGEKHTIDILSINDTSAVILEKFPFGDIKITYKKEK
jgi:hypothetical protein